MRYGRAGRNGAVITFDGDTPCFDWRTIRSTSRIRLAFSITTPSLMV